eukprot:snap_masked-scaffold_16-processed-gene-1.58-mRNA-1 protein AED:0.30 eAED:0.30 QI:0/-1/0/1/-1/1/1/0/233
MKPLSPKEMFKRAVKEEKEIPPDEMVGFVSFIDEHLTELSKENPEASLPRLYFLCVKIWSVFKNEQKELFKDRFYKKNQQDESAFNNSSFLLDDQIPRKKRKKSKDKEGPKKPLTAYTCFIKEQRSKVMKDNPGMSFQAVASLTGKIWQNLEAPEKEKYKEMAREDRKRYENELAVFKEGQKEVVEQFPYPTLMKNEEDQPPNLVLPSAEVPLEETGDKQDVDDTDLEEEDQH